MNSSLFVAHIKVYELLIERDDWLWMVGAQFTYLFTSFYRLSGLPNVLASLITVQKMIEYGIE